MKRPNSYWVKQQSAAYELAFFVCNLALTHLHSTPNKPPARPSAWRAFPLYHPPLIHQNDPILAPNGGRPMGDDNHGAVFGNCFVYLRFGVGLVSPRPKGHTG